MNSKCYRYVPNIIFFIALRGTEYQTVDLCYCNLEISYLKKCNLAVTCHGIYYIGLQH